MFRFALLFLFILSACATDHEPTEPSLTGVCVRSFRAVLEAWETNARERVPDECAFLDAEYRVSLASEMPECEGEPIGVNETVAGCTLPEQHAILIQDQLDELQRLDISIHEWIHALANCVYGDPDNEHLRAGLWLVFGAQSTEGQAFGSASAQPGECL